MLSGRTRWWLAGGMAGVALMAAMLPSCRRGAARRPAPGTIFEAAACGDLADVKRRVGAGESVNVRDGDGRTPLHCATYNDGHEIAEFLIVEGADVDAKDGQGMMPLDLAVQNDFADVAEVLIRSGADVNNRDALGMTPLCWAAMGGRTRTAELLIANGADVNATDKYGNTPLELAITNGHDDVTEVLRQHGGKGRALEMSRERQMPGSAESGSGGM